MSFDWKKILASGEVVKKEFGVSSTFINIVMIFGIVAAVISYKANTFAAIIVFTLAAFYAYYLKISKHYAFTNKRVVLVDQFLGVNTNSIDYSQITDIQYDQSLIEQVLGWGTIYINTAGTHSPITSLPYVSNPQKLKQDLDEIRDKLSTS